MVKLVSQSSAETKSFAKAILGEFSKNGPRPLVLALSGNLGSGKTTFVQGLAQALGIKEKVKSPTFVLAKWYKLRKKNPVFRHFVHVDAYRLEKISEAKHLGLEKVFKDKDAVVAVEWADRVKRFLPRGTLWMIFNHSRCNSERTIQLKAGRTKF